MSSPRRSPVRRAVDAVCAVFSWISGLITVVLMLVIVLEVVLRGASGRSLLGTIELSEVGLVFVVFLGVAYAQRVDAHVSTDLVTSRLPVRVAATARTAALLLAAGVLVWMTSMTALRGWDSFQSGESRFGINAIPLWPARLIIPVGLALLAMQVLFSAADAWRTGWGTRSEAPAASEKKQEKEEARCQPEYS